MAYLYFVLIYFAGKVFLFTKVDFKSLISLPQKPKYQSEKGNSFLTLYNLPTLK